MKKLKLTLNAVFIFVFLFAGIASGQVLNSEKLLEQQNKAEELSRQWSGEAFRHSISLFLETADDWTKLKEFSKASNCLREAARLRFLLIDYAAAKDILKKAIALDQNNKDSVSESKSRSLMSVVLLQEGEIAQSESFYKKAVELADSAQDVEAQAFAYYSAAEFSYFQNESEQTVKLFEKARSFVEKTDNTRLTADILGELSYAYMKQGDGDSGLKTAQESLLKWQNIKDKRGEALIYTAIGLAYKMLGDEQTALDNYYKSQEMFPPDIDLIDQARALTGVASVYDKYGDDYLVEKNMRRAYFLFQNAKYPQGQLSILPTLIKISYNSGQTKLAEEYYEEVKTLSKKLKNEFLLAFADETMGNEKLKNNLPDEAIAFYDAALIMFERLKLKQFKAIVNQRLGEAYLKKGNFEESKSRLNSALQYNREIKDDFAAAENLYYLARLHAALDNYDEALVNIRQSIALTETLYSNVNNSKLKRIYFSSAYDRYELYINFLVKMHARFPGQGFDLQALQAAEKARARLMLETLALSETDLTKDADAVTIKREKEIRALLNTKADKLTDLLSRDTEKSETEKLSGEIKELENELEEIKARLKEQSPIYSAIKNPAPFDAADFQQNILDENSLLLEFSFGKEESYLWLVGKKEISSYILPKREEIENNIEILRNLLKERELRNGESVENFQKRIAESEIRYQSEAKSLSRKLFGQIAEKLSGKRLIIVPDGELHYFPVAALPLPDSDSDDPILLSNETIYEPSAQTLAALAKIRKQPIANAKNLLVFSDPIFTSDDARFPSEKLVAETQPAQMTLNERFRFVESLGRLPRLAASKDESETIIKTIGASDAENYSGFAATRENLLNLKTDEFKILHFATHGYVNEEHPELSGIVLSRFDENGRKLNEFFRIQDIYALNLNADLVVLSACETGIGKQIKGEGLMSLNNAFLQTGAKTVVASLWKVEDGATLELMKNFYGTMADENLTPSQALRRAQIKLRENPNYKSPFYWAAFTVHGDFRNVPKVSSGFGFWVYLLPVAALALIGVYFYRRRRIYSTAKP
jgi:CHAT domain-containing protein